MTLTDVSRSTGISPATVRKSVKDNTLTAWQNERGRWHISPQAAFEWACASWKDGRCLQYPPFWIAGYLCLFHADELTATLKEQLENIYTARGEDIS